MYAKFLVLVFSLVLVPKPSYCGIETVVVTVTSNLSQPTQCRGYKGNFEIRCIKENYPADRVLVRSYSNQLVSFQISKWLSKCGDLGRKYNSQLFNIGAQSSLHLEFETAGIGMCHELYIHSCEIQNLPVHCAHYITATPVA